MASITTFPLGVNHHLHESGGALMS